MNNTNLTTGRMDGAVTNERISVLDTPSLDLGKYRDLVAGESISAEERDEFLLTLWGIMKGFVDNAWDVRLIPAFLPEMFDDPSARFGDAVVSGDEEAIDDEA